MRPVKIFLWGLAASAAILSCDDGPDNSHGELSPFAENYLALKLGSMSSRSMASGNGFANVANESFNRIGGQTSLTFGRTKQDSTETSQDTTYYPSPWVSCAVITTTTNPDKSVTSTYDYGEGCEEGNEYFKYFMHGKVSYTYFSENTREGSVYKDHYFGSYQSENYGGSYYYAGDTSSWSSNGSSSYSGTSQYDTAHQTIRGTYDYEGNEEYTYNDLVYTYSGKGKGTYDEKGSITLINDYSYSSGESSYQTTVLDPLVVRYDCYTTGDGAEATFYCYIPVYVAGREFIRYKDNGVEGSFTIDYGNGECDSKIVIIENGTRVEVDLYKRGIAYGGD